MVLEGDFIRLNGNYFTCKNVINSLIYKDFITFFLGGANEIQHNS
jgi:hypothetical protein